MNDTNKWNINSLLETEIRNYVRNLIHEAMEAGFSVQDLKNTLMNDLQVVKDHAEYRVKINHFLKGGYDYCVKMLGEPIGKGSSRAVFQIDDTRVLKLATNMKGIAQNKAEVAVYNQTADKTFMPIIYNDSDMENYFYVIAEYVLPAEEDDFKNVIGIPFDTFEEIVYNDKIEDVIEDHKYSPKVRGLFQYMLTMSKIGVNIDDWFYIDNWGLAKRNGKAAMVTLDNGFTNYVANHFYENPNTDFTSIAVSDKIGNMMGVDDEYRQNIQRELEKKFSKVLPKDTVGRDVVEWAISNRDKYYQEIIEEFRESNFQDDSITYELISDYINEKYPKFDWGRDIHLPKYAYNSVTEEIKNLPNNINDIFKK